MKFDKLFKLVYNEALETEDMAELAADPVSDPTAVSADTPFPSAPMSPDMMNTDQKVEYLVKNSKVINRDKNKSEEQKIAQAKWIIDNGFFDQFAEGIAARTDALADIGGEPDALEELPPELETDQPSNEDIPDVDPALRAHKTLRQREEEDELEGLTGGQD